MDWSLVVGFAIMAAVIEVSPGPNFLLITRSVPSFGMSGAIANCTGFGCSYMLHGALAIYGVSAILAAEPVLLQGIQLSGACYLLYLGIKSFKPQGEQKSNLKSIVQPVDILLTHELDSIVMETDIAPNRRKMLSGLAADNDASDAGVDILLDGDTWQTRRAGLFNCYRDGLVTSALNPKITLFYMAAFPQFIQPGTDAVAYSILLVALHITICAVWTVVVAFALNYALSKAQGSNVADLLNRFSGIALIGLSMAFFTSVAQAF